MASLFSFAGENTPPKFGDYEAQRHWMEITTNLPLSDWYRQTPDNDLQWWGLDYPPLTAFHSWICGKLLDTNFFQLILPSSATFEPESMALTTSRGYQTPSHRLFMRTTVIVSELLVYFSGLLYYLLSVHKKRENVVITYGNFTL